MLNCSAIGNLGSDPDLKYSAGGAAFLRFNLATNGRRRDAAGNWGDHTEWVRITVLGKRAESLAEHLRKGMRVYASGRLEARPWTGQSGQVNAGLELIASDVEFMSTRNEDDGQQAARPARQQQGADDDPDLPF